MEPDIQYPCEFHCFCQVDSMGNLRCHRCGLIRVMDEMMDQGANS